MKTKYLGGIATGIVIAVGIVAVLPAFLQEGAKPYVPVLLAFEIHGEENLPDWCSDVSALLDSRRLKAAVFVAGNVAERYPQCVAAFSGSGRVDVGSQTYSYADLTSMADYSAALGEVERGKRAVDAAGDIDSTIFKAPYGRTDENIYSLLSRSGILADFSYQDQYNKYHQGQFISFDAASYDGAHSDPESLLSLTSREPVIVSFDSSVPADRIGSFLDRVASGRGEHYDLKFVNASELTQMQLTGRAQA